MTDLSAAFGKPFAQQVAAFRLRLAHLQPTLSWKDVWQGEHDRAFMVAGAQKAELLADLAAAIDKAVSKGTTLEEFRKDFAQAVTDHNWHGWAGEETEKGRAWRTRVIYRTNLSTSYAAGRYAQLKAAGFPIWVYFHGNSREPRKLHLGWNGLALPAGHPWWVKHFPPNGWGCSCYVSGARSAAGVRRLGGNPDLALPDGWDMPDPKTLAPPGVGKGWAYAPGASTARTLIPIVEKLAALPAPLGADLIASWPDRLFTVWSKEFSSFVDQAMTSLPQKRGFVVGALKPKWLKALSAEGVTPATAEIMAVDERIAHAFRGTKQAPVDIAWFRDLPTHLRKPDIVILDRRPGRQPSILLVFKGAGDQIKLVITLDYNLKRIGPMNVANTGTLGSISDIKAILGKSGLLIEGSL